MPIVRLLVVVFALSWPGIVACGSPQKPAPRPSASSSTSTTVNTTTASTSQPGTTASPSAPTTTAPCVGLSICPPPPPDAEGNPACFYSDGWQATSSGAGIEVWYFHEPQNMAKPDKVTAVVRKKDGTIESQEADIEAGQQVHRFEFATINQSAVAEVFFDSSAGRCFVIGPGS
ncbi:hypothetical protein LAUMK4_03416 [Mycobacterium persicum]|uniref:Uncharacterized protein n=1 Tax=Mycobacterium persicum TaxID=1487726 RepID=A0AB38UVR4_9MYCO|nr:hypothetical protein LAUMK15_03729 [Mycobacterium persicum]VAZ84643.1 hypothetical protein LAUMK42_03466 [Mycobacterium persicum]VAZ96187.1 hypothetical protein LAUMK4_03416 [Mycobacterium persicum]